MSILFWYIVRHYLGILTLCLTGLTTIYLVIDFFEKLRKFLRHDAELTSMLLYFVLKIPDISFQLVPFAVLMASLLAIGLLNKNQEITAMRSCGVSIVHVTMPFLAVAGLITVILLGLTAVVIPLANAKAEYIRTVEIQKKPQPLSFTNENLWLNIRNHALMHVQTSRSRGHAPPRGHTLPAERSILFGGIADGGERRFHGWPMVLARRRSTVGQIGWGDQDDSTDDSSPGVVLNSR